MNQQQKVNAIITYYQSEYEKIHGRKPIVNRNKLYYTILNVLKDLSVDEAKALLDFYLKTDKEPSLQKFCYEYDEIDQKRLIEVRDVESRKAIMRETQKNVLEFRKRYGNAG